MTTGINQRVAQSRTFLEALIERRCKFIEGLDANRGEINLDIFERNPGVSNDMGGSAWN